MVTRTTPCLANGPPAAPCNAPEPPTNPPPWIHTITGSLRAVGSAGRQTFRNRQSSDGAAAAPAHLPAPEAVAEPSLHAVRAVLRGLAHARPPRRRLRRPPPQVADGRRREGDALVGDDSVVDHALQLAGIHLARLQALAHAPRRQHSSRPPARPASTREAWSPSKPPWLCRPFWRIPLPLLVSIDRRGIVQAVSTRRLPKPPAESA